MGDFKPLNDRIKKQYYDINTSDNIWKKVDPDSELYMVMDATSSYNQIRCSPETNNMMCIALPSKSCTRYFHFQTTGQGCANSGPAWCAASDEELKGVVWKDAEKGDDDALAQAKNEEDMIPKLTRLFKAVRAGNLTFSKRKIQVGQTVEFGGYVIDKNQKKAIPRKVYSILGYPEPENEAELKRFLGLCGQFGQFFPDLSHMGKPLRELLKNIELSI